MGKDFKSLDDLFKYVEKQTKAALNDEVAETAKIVEAEHVQSDVYDAYKDPYTDRRGELADRRNMIHTVSDTVAGMELFINNIAKGNDAADYTEGVEAPNYLAGIIHYGRENHQGLYTTSKRSHINVNDYLQPRPFITNAMDTMAKTLEHVDSLREGLRKRGIQTD